MIAEIWSNFLFTFGGHLESGGENCLWRYLETARGMDLRFHTA